MNRDNEVNNTNYEINAIEWYVPHYTPSIPQQAMLLKQISSKTPLEIQFVERSVLTKEVNTQNFWTFDLCTQEGLNFSIGIIVGLQQRDKQDSQNINKDTFYKLPVTSAQCIIVVDKDTDSAILLNYNDDYYAQGYGKIMEAF